VRASAQPPQASRSRPQPAAGISPTQPQRASLGATKSRVLAALADGEAMAAAGDRHGHRHRSRNGEHDAVRGWRRRARSRRPHAATSWTIASPQAPPRTPPPNRATPRRAPPNRASSARPAPSKATLARCQASRARGRTRVTRARGRTHARVALECVSAAGAPTGPSPTPRFRPPVCEIRRSAWSPRDLSWQFFGLFPFVFLAWRPPGTGADHDRCQARERRRSRATARQGQGRAAIGAESAPTTRRLNPACKGSVARPASAARRVSRIPVRCGRCQLESAQTPL
jgi:hypothetical protein